MKLKEHFKLKELDEKVGLFDKDPEYIIRDDKVMNSYIVTAWTHGKAPSNVYTVSHQTHGNKWVCNCPVRTPNCKHVKMVKEWIKDGKPSLIDKESEDELRKFLKQRGVKI